MEESRGGKETSEWLCVTGKRCWWLEDGGSKVERNGWIKAILDGKLMGLREKIDTVG